MTLSSLFPRRLLTVHKVAGVLLLPLVFLQKHMVPAMRYRSGSCDRRNRWLHPEVARRIHVVVGYSIVAAIGYMAFAGFSLRKHSTFSHFSLAMVGFVAPWVLFLILIPLTVWKKWAIAHSIVGNVVFKACVAVPLARALGCAFQSRYIAPLFDSMGSAYYAGIGCSAVVVGAWALYDVSCTVAAWKRVLTQRKSR